MDEEMEMKQEEHEEEFEVECLEIASSIVPPAVTRALRTQVTGQFLSDQFQPHATTYIYVLKHLSVPPHFVDKMWAD